MINRNKLRSAIAEAGTTQRELAEKLGISENTFTNKIHGKTYFDVLQVEKMCEILKITDNCRKAEIFLSSLSQ